MYILEYVCILHVCITIGILITITAMIQTQTIYTICMAVSRFFPYPRIVTQHRPFGKGRDLGHGMAFKDMK